MRRHRERVCVALVDVDASRFPAPAGPRPPHARGGGEYERGPVTVLDRVELSALSDRRLVDVTTDDQLGAGVGEPTQDVVSPP